MSIRVSVSVTCNTVFPPIHRVHQPSTRHRAWLCVYYTWDVSHSGVVGAGCHVPRNRRGPLIISHLVLPDAVPVITVSKLGV